MRVFVPFCVVVLSACEESKAPGDGTEEGSASLDSGEAEPAGVAALGSTSHELSTVTVTVVGIKSDGLRTPRDLAFNPDVPGQLWVVNRYNDAATIFTDAGEASQESDMRIDPYAMHFMEEVSSISMGAVTFEDSSARTFGTSRRQRATA